jgi:hypothetical protein
MAKTDLYVPEYPILPFGHAKKSDLQKITLAAVSAPTVFC